MPIKCIVIGQSTDSRRAVRLQLGIDLTKRFDAHLNVVCVGERPDYPAGMIGRAVSLAYLEEATEAAKQRIETVKLEVEAACASLPSWEWHGEEGAAEEIIANFAHLSDLVIVGQSPLTHPEGMVSLHISDYLVMSAGCPLLLVPKGWKVSPLGRRILIAWKNSKEAISAVRSSFPFLCDAEEVFILAAPTEKSETSPGSDLRDYLGYHGVNAKIYGATKGDGGEAILAAASDCGCDLIVMGAMGHSRWREMILGGATDHVMRHTTIPVVMRH
ncbi:MAG: universal stress protein [Rhodospirillales bacterium]|nr:universal stress protein [Rhodospirillales bacterium]